MNLRLLKAGLWFGLLGVFPALGQFTQISTPGASYTGSTTQLPITPVNGTSVGSITDGTLTLTLTPNLDVHTVPSGGWSTWGTPPNAETATPRVLGKYTSLATLTITLSSPRTTFGFEAEPNTFNNFSFTATFLSGSTTLGTVTRSVNGNAGSLLFAATSTTPITSVVLTTPISPSGGANGFALAQFRYSPTGPVVSGPVSVPALSIPALGGLAMLLMAAGVLLVRRQNHNHV